MNRRPVRALLCNLRVSSVPALAVPWLAGLCVLHRVDVALLQEATSRHRRILRRVPGYTLVGIGDEALFVKRHLYSRARVMRDVSFTWRGPHRQHPARSLPLALVRGWLTVGSLHFPPNWTTGAADRRAAGEWMLAHLSDVVAEDGPQFLAGDMNATRLDLREADDDNVLRGHRLTGRGIDYAAHRGCTVTKWRRLRRGPGMDHKPVLMVVAP